MPPQVLALIESVFALASHHDDRARRGISFDHESIRVRASLNGPELDGTLELRLTITAVPRSEEREVSEHSVRVGIDSQRERLQLTDLELGEQPLDPRSCASVLEALEAWCYERTPLDRHG